MDRKNIDEILAEHKLQLSGCTDTGCAVEISQILSLQYIFSGEVSKLGASYFATINYINVETSRIERSTTQKFMKIDEIYDVLPAAIAELTENSDYSGPPSGAEQPGSWWDEMEKKQQAGFITMIAGCAATAAGSGLLALDANYYKTEVLPLYEVYQSTGGGFDIYSEKAAVKNIMLIGSIGTLGGGIIAAVAGTVLWLSDPVKGSADTAETASTEYMSMPIPPAMTITGQHFSTAPIQGFTQPELIPIQPLMVMIFFCMHIPQPGLSIPASAATES